MDRDGAAAGALNWLADTVLVGVLATLAALPVLTAPAAFSAAIEVLADRRTGGSLVHRYVRTLRTGARLRRGAPLALLGLACGVVALADLGWALAGPPSPLRTGVLAAGVLLALASQAVVLVASCRLGGDVGPRRLLTRSALLAAANPHRMITLLVAATAVVVTTVALPPALPAGVGLLARVAARVVPAPTTLPSPSAPPQEIVP